MRVCARPWIETVVSGKQDACRKALLAAAHMRSCVSSSVKWRKFPRKAANRLSMSALRAIKTALWKHRHMGLQQSKAWKRCHGEVEVASDQSGAFR